MGCTLDGAAPDNKAAKRDRKSGKRRTRSRIYIRVHVHTDTEGEIENELGRGRERFDKEEERPTEPGGLHIHTHHAHTQREREGAKERFAIKGSGMETEKVRPLNVDLCGLSGIYTLSPYLYPSLYLSPSSLCALFILTVAAGGAAGIRRIQYHIGTPLRRGFRVRARNWTKYQGEHESRSERGDNERTRETTIDQAA